jgi:hypothetical protein
MNYQRHFVLVGLMSILLVAVLQMWPLLGAPDHWRVWQLVLFGTLHAIAVVGALRRPGPIAKRILFVLAAGGLTVAALLVGTLAARLLGPLVFVMMFVLTSILGAASYGLLIRWMWMRHLSVRAIGKIVLGCVVATSVAMFSVGNTEYQEEGITLLWWLAFSLGLWLCTRRTANNLMQPTCETHAADE